MPSVLGLESGLIIAILLLLPLFSFAQDSSAEHSAFEFFDSQYGSDPEINKGRKYINLERYQSGHPFFASEKTKTISFSTGKIRLGKKMIYNAQLAYDVYNQEVILQSRSFSGVSNDIILLNKLIDEFWIGKHHFIKNPYDEIDALYLEKIEGTDTDIVCYFSYYKEYRLQENSGKGEMGFGELRTRKYLFVNQAVHAFKRKNSFLKNLSEQDREASISFIKSNPNKFKLGDSQYFNSGKNSGNE